MPAALLTKFDPESFKNTKDKIQQNEINSNFFTIYQFRWPEFCFLTSKKMKAGIRKVVIEEWLLEDFIQLYSVCY
jgi:hypothetical protein